MVDAFIRYRISDPLQYYSTLRDDRTAGDRIQRLVNSSLRQVLGSHVRHYDTPRGTVEGVSFAVWAPNARGVKVTGDFDYWEARAYPMRSLGSSGIWEIFIPGVTVGSRLSVSRAGGGS